MYSLVRHLGSREGMLTEVPAFVGSFVVAEVFYKFHSFSLECGAFLGTWLVASYLLTHVARYAKR